MSRAETFMWAAQLLRYPDEELTALAREARREPAPVWAAAFLGYAAATPLLDLQAAFVQTFDLNRAGCLYLTTHAYGDSPLQGRALAALTELYRDSGCTPCGRELPDYLPLVLEFLALSPAWAAACLCGKFTPAARSIAAHLAAENSPWAPMLRAVVHAMGECVANAASDPAGQDLAPAGRPAVPGCRRETLEIPTQEVFP